MFKYYISPPVYLVAEKIEQFRSEQNFQLLIKAKQMLKRVICVEEMAPKKKSRDIHEKFYGLMNENKIFLHETTWFQQQIDATRTKVVNCRGGEYEQLVEFSILGFNGNCLNFFFNYGCGHMWSTLAVLVTDEDGTEKYICGAQSEEEEKTTLKEIIEFLGYNIPPILFSAIIASKLPKYIRKEWEEKKNS